MKDLFCILTIISAVTAAPLLSARLDLLTNDGSDLTSFGSDMFDSTFDDSSQPLLLSMTPGESIDSPWSIPGDRSWTDTDRSSPGYNGGGGGGGIPTVPITYPPGMNPSPPDDTPWSIPGDDSWTDAERTPRQPSEGYGITTVNPDVNGPTAFELSPEQVTALIAAGMMVINGVTWVYNGATQTINSLGDWVPGGGF